MSAGSSKNAWPACGRKHTLVGEPNPELREKAQLALSVTSNLAVKNVKQHRVDAQLMTAAESALSRHG